MMRGRHYFAHCVAAMSALANAAIPISHMAFAGAAMEDSMNNQFRTIKMTSKHNGDNVEIIVTGQSPDPVSVNYKLEVSGQSTTRHSGSTRLAAGDKQTLSRVRVSTAKRWCAVLQVEQSNGVNYRLTDGMCG